MLLDTPKDLAQRPPSSTDRAANRSRGPGRCDCAWSVRLPQGSKSRPPRSRTLRRLNRPGWLDASELRIGLGCMRMSTDADRDEELARETIAAALAAGVTVFDTAHAYGQGEAELGHNERLLAGALAGSDARIVTKGGMKRPAGAWIPDGRAKAILADCEASLDALGGLPIDLYLIHAPDSRTPWRTSVRALTRLLDEGLVRHVGLSNVNRHQLDEALEARPRRRRRGRTRSVRRPRAPRRNRRALRGARNRRDRALPARWVAARGRAGPAPAAAVRSRGRDRRDPGRGRARLAARPVPGGRRDPRRAPPGDGSVRCARGEARARRAVAGRAAPRLRRPQPRAPRASRAGRNPRR